MTTTTTPRRETRIVRQAQGAWRWQTPYRVQTYVARPGAGGALVWKLAGRSPKMTLAQATARAPHALWGGLGNRRVMTEADRAAVYNADR